MSQTYQKAYENKPVWVNDHAPAINETRMNNISSALDTIDDRVIELQSEAKKLLASLDDTTISNPQNEDLLVYNSTTQKWENRVYSPGTFDYEELDNLPQINSVELVGDKSSEDLGLLEYQNITKAEMDILIEQGTWKHNTYYNITDESDMKDLIDDTSTTATDKSWSAKKSNDEISEINSTLTNISNKLVTTVCTYNSTKGGFVPNNNLFPPIQQVTLVARNMQTGALHVVWYDASTGVFRNGQNISGNNPVDSNTIVLQYFA